MRTGRREFLATLAMAAVATGIRAQQGRENSTPSGDPVWQNPILDCHFHMRISPEANVAHLDGSGTAKAFLLTTLERNSADDVRALRARYPGRFPGYAASTDPAKPDARDLLTAAVRTSGAKAFGEVKYHVASDGPEMRRVYALAAELDVPILIHFQDVEDKFSPAVIAAMPTPNFAVGVFNTDFKHFDRILKEFPKTRFVGHADTFWANVSANYAYKENYPSGPIAPGGITDHWLSDYPNLFGDLSARSGWNMLTRDPSFTGDFLKRHVDKLHFGSDCPCTDGKGGTPGDGRRQNGPLAGRCIARETLTVLTQSTSSEAFRKLTWENGSRVYGLKKSSI